MGVKPHKPPIWNARGGDPVAAFQILPSRTIARVKKCNFTLYRGSLRAVHFS